MEIETLREIGLTEGETKVYLTLTKLGQTKTGVLAKESNVSSSKVYKILDRLEKKGLVGHVIIGKIKHFNATEPKRILDYIGDKEKELSKQKKNIEQMIPLLEMERKISKKKTELTLYEGFNGITQLFYNMLDELKKGDEYHVITADYSIHPKGIEPWFQKYHIERAERGIKLKLLAGHDMKGKLVESTNKLSEIKYLPEELLTSFQVTIYKNKIFLIFLADTAQSIFIESEKVAESFRKYFNAFWKMAKQ